MKTSRRRRWSPAAMVLAAVTLLGCTPLGIWVFTEPAVTVTSLSFTGDTAEPIRVTLQVRNPNDFDIKLEQVRLFVSIEGQAVVDTAIGATATLMQAERRDVTLGVGQGMLASGFSSLELEPGRHSYAIRGEAHLSTPIGLRKIQFQQAGEGEWAGMLIPGQGVRLASASRQG